MKELELLLDHYWVVKDDDKDVFYRVKDSIPEFKSFLNEIINQHLIKLEKIPGSAESFMGIQEFNHPREYVLLCLLLMFLEDRSRDEQFVLSEITEFIAGNNIGKEKIDWTQYSHRKHFIKVLRFAQTLGLMKVNDGDDQKFAYHDDAEVLYESTGPSFYCRYYGFCQLSGYGKCRMGGSECRSGCHPTAAGLPQAVDGTGGLLPGDGGCGL
jgi:uncharacterized protein (TIGR02678 family)